MPLILAAPIFLSETFELNLKKIKGQEMIKRRMEKNNKNKSRNEKKDNGRMPKKKVG